MIRRWLRCCRAFINKYPVRYRDYTLRQLCQEMHDLYVSFDVKDLQKAMFRQQSFPSVVMNPAGCA